MEKNQMLKLLTCSFCNLFNFLKKIFSFHLFFLISFFIFLNTNTIPILTKYVPICSYKREILHYLQLLKMNVLNAMDSIYHINAIQMNLFSLNIRIESLIDNCLVMRITYHLLITAYPCS